MKVTGIIAEVGKAREGVSQSTGKAWRARPLSILIPYFNDKGEERYDNVVADYYGDLSDDDLQAAIAQQTRFHMTIGFSTSVWNGRRYTNANVFNIQLPM
ncbi:MAG: hypothetical protein IKP91_11855 [Bacteroidaceae bacterium]|nr:hypothetical protein [Bacteroidaceae bacterium]